MTTDQTYGIRLEVSDQGWRTPLAMAVEDDARQRMRAVMFKHDDDPMDPRRTWSTHWEVVLQKIGPVFERSDPTEIDHPTVFVCPSGWFVHRYYCVGVNRVNRSQDQEEPPVHPDDVPEIPQRDTSERHREPMPPLAAAATIAFVTGVGLTLLFWHWLPLAIGTLAFLILGIMNAAVDR